MQFDGQIEVCFKYSGDCCAGLLNKLTDRCIINIGRSEIHYEARSDDLEYKENAGGFPEKVYGKETAFKDHCQ